MELDDVPVQERIAAFCDSLPHLTQEDVEASSNDSCPICLSSFSSFFSAEPQDCLGVTQLKCGHIFCRTDLLEWIRNLHGSCPTCRFAFLAIKPPGSDDESSDGGEYIPDEDDEFDDAFNTSDGFTDMEYDTEDMDMDEDEELWSSDGLMPGVEAQASSDGDNDYDIEDVAVELSVSVDAVDSQDSSNDESDSSSSPEPK
ncbi:unnamed protein product [Mycena citricolor]|uniref:RING-type domain-containing protein n=1 Tax=Mycena citricolor TaxID=2018698 RepID=A0AAD2K2P1_9AGAR|nr:unnamed protein product [Mycena citricolor]